MPAFFVVCSRSFLNECVISIAFLTLFIRYNRMAIPARVRNARKPQCVVIIAKERDASLRSA